MSTGDPQTDALITNLVAATEGALTQEDVVERLSQIYYLLKDTDVGKILSSDIEKQRMGKIKMGLSHLLRTTRIEAERTIVGMKLRWRISARRALLIDPEEPGDMSQYHSWINFGDGAIEDTRHGWRGKLATERIRTFKIEGQEQKRGLIARFFNR